MKSNLHTHSYFSDGNSHPEDYIISALSRGFGALGFTEHSPLPFDNPFSFREGKKEEYLALLEALKEKYRGKLKVYVGMEMDYIPGMSEDFDRIRQEYGLEYLIGSVHLVKPDSAAELWFTDGPHSDTYDQGVSDFFGGDIRKAVTTYFRQVNEMITTQHFEVIGHFDKIKMHNRNRFFLESDDWYQDLLKETIHLIKAKGLIAEINTRGLYKGRSDSTFPGIAALRLMKVLDVPVMVNSDAHQPHELDGEFATAFSLLNMTGFKEIAYYDEGRWKSAGIS